MVVRATCGFCYWDYRELLVTPLLLIQRQYGSKQFIPATHELNLLEFDYGDKGCGRIVELANAWKEPHRSELA